MSSRKHASTYWKRYWRRCNLLIKGKVDGNVMEPFVFKESGKWWNILSIANGILYGLVGFVHTDDVERGTKLAKQMYTGRY